MTQSIFRGAGWKVYLYRGENAIFTNHAGELRSYWTAAGTMLEGDINGDGKADFSIFFVDINHALTFHLNDDDLFGGP
ncbi:MAG: hypothetical protein U1E15_13110 [Hyphomicrobiales bacterium]